MFYRAHASIRAEHKNIVSVGRRLFCRPSVLKRLRGIKTILNSYDVLNGPHTFTVAWTSAGFRDSNPVLYKALIAAIGEATESINKDKRAAADIWIAASKSTLALDFVDKVVAGPQVRWTMVPENTMKFARSMASTSVIKAAPSSWQDYFFPEVHSLGGS